MRRESQCLSALAADRLAWVDLRGCVASIHVSNADDRHGSEGTDEADVECMGVQWRNKGFKLVYFVKSEHSETNSELTATTQHKARYEESPM